MVSARKVSRLGKAQLAFIFFSGKRNSLGLGMESATTNSLPNTRDGIKEETQESSPGQPRVLDTSMSFSEIFRLVQTGQDIPGLQKLNITATNRSPTPSQMAPKPKPWEKKQ
ncbi:hypothetical protein JD844_025481 [Phrynosoma platyrhinos]|uniref:Peroxisomal membrane protein PEX14-like KPWE domain-containing protein n=1 Tax=Phrynosoma platyrhinos TaxID=52577 RepID=A0ABQ7SZB6_PHRPL|nr:hypothetical protein JD844_025481 [Phrynosoma platyrhinos]